MGVHPGYVTGDAISFTRLRILYGSCQTVCELVIGECGRTSGEYTCCSCPAPFCMTDLQAGAEAGWRELHMQKGGQRDGRAVAGCMQSPPPHLGLRTAIYPRSEHVGNAAHGYKGDRKSVV